MHVFRNAHEAKDAKRIIDQRNEAGERVIASRRLRARGLRGRPNQALTVRLQQMPRFVGMRNGV